jgi:hypothetical protein
VNDPTNVPQQETPTKRISVKDADSQIADFYSTGLHEDYNFTYNEYTGELTVERIEYSPRGNDEWARTSAIVVAAWPDDRWESVTLFNPSAS